MNETQQYGIESFKFLLQKQENFCKTMHTYSDLIQAIKRIYGPSKNLKVQAVISALALDPYKTFWI